MVVAPSSRFAGCNACAVHTEPFLLPVGIQHSRCPCRFFNPSDTTRRAVHRCAVSNTEAVESLVTGPVSQRGSVKGGGSADCRDSAGIFGWLGLPVSHGQNRGTRTSQYYCCCTTACTGSTRGQKLFTGEESNQEKEPARAQIVTSGKRLVNTKFT